MSSSQHLASLPASALKPQRKREGMKIRRRGVEAGHIALSQSSFPIR